MADLTNLLKFLQSGNQGQAISSDMYQNYGGDDLLSALKKFDPNAKWTDAQMAGESGTMGKRLDFDVTKLPTSGRGNVALDLRTSDFGDLKPGVGAALDDDLYGSVRNSKEFMKPKDAAWTKFAPLVVAGLAPMAGAALAGMGIGGTAGLTSAVTGSGLSGAAPGWATSLVKGLPSNMRGVAEGNFDFTKLLPMVGQFAGVNPSYISGGMTLAQLGRRK